MSTSKDTIEEHFVEHFEILLKTKRYDEAFNCEYDNIKGDHIDQICLTEDNVWLPVKIFYLADKDSICLETKYIVVFMPRSHESFNFFYDVLNIYIEAYNAEKRCNTLSNKAKNMLRSKGCLV